MRTASGQPLPNPLAAHAPVDMATAVAAPPAPRETRPSQDTTSSRPSSSAAAHLDMPSPTSTVARRPSPSTANSHRPSLARAKSDFGPRQPVQQPEEHTDDVSVDGHFKIRHGWDDQLNSEEYSNMLTSVRCREHFGASFELTTSCRTSSCTIPTRNTKRAAIQRVKSAHRQSRNGACATV